MKYKVEKGDNNSGIIPEGLLIPEETYFFDLIWIEEVNFPGSTGPSYRWTFKFSEIEGQTAVVIDGQEVDISKFQASALTPVIPTLNNKLGKFIKSLFGSAELGQEGDTMEIVRAKYRVKGFLERKVGKQDKIYHNVTKLVEGTAKKGEGVGVFGIPNWMIDDVNKILEKEGCPLLEKKAQPEKVDSVEGEEKKEVAKNPENVTQEKAQKEAASGGELKTKKNDIPW